MTPKPTLQRPLLIASSLAVVALAIYASLSILPLQPPRPDPNFVYRADNPASALRAGTAPVFIFDQDFFPRQCGKARIAADGKTAIAPYDSDLCRDALRAAARVSVEQASFRLLWSLIPTAERNAIGARGQELASSLGSSFNNAVNSAYFERVYRPEMTDILRQALRRAWDTPHIRAGFSQAMQSVDPALIDRLIDGILPIAFEKAENSLWESLAFMANSMLGKPVPEEQETPVARAIKAIFEDPRVHDQVLNTFPEMATDPAVSRFATQFASEIGLALIADPRVPILLTSLLTDPQLSSDSAEIGINPTFLTRNLPQWLLRYRHPKDHNPLVSYIVRSIVRGDRSTVILALSAAQLDVAQRQGLTTGIRLQDRPS